ncbi:MAG: hypothetical protein H0U87_07455 [Acidobacteria bacterium]|nr:hypothetical protein [Acidobacteriota bacterium]
MKNFLIAFFLILFSSGVFAQTPSKIPIDEAATAKRFGGEKERFERALAQPDAAARIILLQKFVADFPESAERNRALELVVGARAALADEKLRAGDAAGGAALFKLAVKDAPAPVSDKLFGDVLLHIPTNLFFGGAPDAATEIVAAIEKKIENNPKQLVALATFYIGVENAEQAKRLAEKAAALDPNLPAAYQTLGLAARLNFNLDTAAAAYSKALELDKTSTVSKRSLAEMNRALGKSDEAAALYREILTANAADISARNGLILALFDAGKKAEAETEMQKSLAENPNNLLLLAGAADWYAAHETDGARAVELARRAVAVEPRYVWSYIALARALNGQNRFYDAERALLAARAYGNFPTLDYELAAVRFAAGYYREAAQELAKNFTLKNDAVSTKLGWRVEKQAPSFIDLLALERRAAIFAPAAADSAESAERLKSLLDFYQKLEAEKSDDAEISNAADKFVEGTDKMKLHRRLFAAALLLEKNKALPKASELIKNAAPEVDAALDAPNAASAILAEQLYESRAIAARRGELIIVPDLPRQTLSNIVRGRIEEIGGLSLLKSDEPAAAVVRLKRAVGILPEKSAWWRSSQWRLGAALQAEGKAADALDAYIKSYADEPARSAAKRIVLETLYRQVNGTLDGLDAKIGAKTAEEETVAAATATPQKAQTQSQPVNNQVAENKSPATAISAKTATAAETVAAAQNSDRENNQGKAQSPLFEPIIITVPKIDASKAATQTDTADAKKIAAVEASGEARPRKISGDAVANKPCRIIASQETISLVADGGNLSVLVGFEDNNGATISDIKEVTATSSDAQAVEAVLDAETGGRQTNGVVFIVKSIGGKTGVFTVTFDAPPCGKKEITVKVR